jgi:hypothetical protein
MKELYNLLLLVAICLVIYLAFRSFNFKSMMVEGMTDGSGNLVSVSNGIAGNAAAYAASLKSKTIMSEDALLISKYRSDYESAILNLDDLINTLMLKTALSVDEDKPGPAIEKLSKMNQAKGALNSVMKFLDTR